MQLGGSPETHFSQHFPFNGSYPVVLPHGSTWDSFGNSALIAHELCRRLLNPFKGQAKMADIICVAGFMWLTSFRFMPHSASAEQNYIYVALPVCFNNLHPLKDVRWCHQVRFCFCDGFAPFKGKKKKICRSTRNTELLCSKTCHLDGKKRPLSDKHVISSAQLWLHSRKGFNNGWLLGLVGRNKAQWLRCSFESSQRRSFLTLSLTSPSASPLQLGDTHLARPFPCLQHSDILNGALWAPAHRQIASRTPGSLQRSCSLFHPSWLPFSFGCILLN